MAKMFYTLEEVCQKLGKTEDEVREMVASGQLSEFRDRDKLMFKVEQIDLLAGGDEDTSDFHLELEESAAGASGLELSGSGIPLSDSREGTGISVFDTNAGDETGFAADAQDEDDELDLESVGSGSGLLDLTRESDDTSLGAELLEEVYSGEDNIEIPANASGLFEAAAADPIQDEAVAASGIAVPMMVEAYDGAGSGLGVGMMIGALVAMVALAFVVVVSVLGGTSQLALMMSDNMMVYAGGLLGATVVLGVIGLLIGKASE